MGGRYGSCQYVWRKKTWIRSCHRKIDTRVHQRKETLFLVHVNDPTIDDLDRFDWPLVDRLDMLEFRQRIETFDNTAERYKTIGHPLASIRECDVELTAIRMPIAFVGHA